MSERRVTEDSAQSERGLSGPAPKAPRAEK